MSSRSLTDVADIAPRGVALLGSTGSIGRQTVEVLAAHPDAFRVVALAAGTNEALLAEQAGRLGAPIVALGASEAGLAELAARDDVDLVVVATGGVVSLRSVLAALAGRQGRRHGQQGDAGRRRPPGHARGSSPGLPGPGPRQRRPVREPARLAAADRLRALRHLAVPGRRIDGFGVARLILTASGGPFLDASPAELAAVTPAASPSAPDLDHGRQDHDRLRHPRQQGPGGHRSALAVRCRLRRHRGRHPPAERRPLRRPLRGRLPQGPTGHPGHATSHPVRPDLSRSPAIARSAARPRGRGPPRLPCAR